MYLIGYLPSVASPHALPVELGLQRDNDLTGGAPTDNPQLLVVV
jgi:hypothetical protein